MKKVMVIIDGMGDEPIPELHGKTPLEAAFVPHIHYLATKGRIGSIRTTFKGFPIESMVCIMGLLGYAPEEFYPAGRAGFEAMAQGIQLRPNDLVLRCNTVTIDPEKQVLTDFTGGLISNSAAQRLVSGIELPGSNWQLYPGQSYRNILVIRDAGIDAKTLKCFEPHMNIGGKIVDLLPRSTDPKAAQLAAQLGEFLLGTQQQIASQRQEEGCAGNMLWVWSPSHKAEWPSFEDRTGWKGAVVGGLDFLQGIAIAAQIHWEDVPGATGYIDTDYEAKTRYAIKHLQKYDFLVVHINATDEEAHQLNWKGKQEVIEKIDRLVIGPLLHELESAWPENYRIVICGDHTTRCRDGKHTDGLVPFALYPAGNGSGEALSESACEKIPPLPSLGFLKDVFSR